jgi:hypothetical protein
MPSPHVCSNPTADALKQLRAAIAKSDEENRATLDGAVDAKIKAEEQLQAGGCPACRWANRWLSCVSLPPPPHTHICVACHFKRNTPCSLRCSLEACVLPLVCMLSVVLLNVASSCACVLSVVLLDLGGTCSPSADQGAGRGSAGCH